jgi:predicted Zn-ribbon and HTH transcriptional regulator
MFRKDLIPLLQDRPWSLNEIADLLEMDRRDVEDDLDHLIKSLKHSGYELHIQPATCRKCGFEFDKNKLKKPGKCPHCHGTWIAEPLLRIEKSG